MQYYWNFTGMPFDMVGELKMRLQGYLMTKGGSYWGEAKEYAYSQCSLTEEERKKLTDTEKYILLEALVNTFIQKNEEMDMLYRQGNLPSIVAKDV